MQIVSFLWFKLFPQGLPYQCVCEAVYLSTILSTVHRLDTPKSVRLDTCVEMQIDLICVNFYVIFYLRQLFLPPAVIQERGTNHRFSAKKPMVFYFFIGRNLWFSLQKPQQFYPQIFPPPKMRVFVDISGFIGL